MLHSPSEGLLGYMVLARPECRRRWARSGEHGATLGGMRLDASLTLACLCLLSQKKANRSHCRQMSRYQTCDSCRKRRTAIWPAVVGRGSESRRQGCRRECQCDQMIPLMIRDDQDGMYPEEGACVSPSLLPSLVHVVHRPPPEWQRAHPQKSPRMLEERRKASRVETAVGARRRAR